MCTRYSYLGINTSERSCSGGWGLGSVRGRSHSVLIGYTRSTMSDPQHMLLVIITLKVTTWAAGRDTVLGD